MMKEEGIRKRKNVNELMCEMEPRSLARKVQRGRKEGKDYAAAAPDMFRREKQRRAL